MSSGFALRAYAVAARAAWKPWLASSVWTHRDREADRGDHDHPQDHPLGPVLDRGYSDGAEQGADHERNHAVDRGCALGSAPDALPAGEQIAALVLRPLGDVRVRHLSSPSLRLLAWTVAKRLARVV